MMAVEKEKLINENKVPRWLMALTIITGVILCIGVTLYTFVNVNNKLANKYKTFPNIFGVSYYPVLDGSLHEGYEYGDLILIDKNLDEVAGSDKVGLTNWRSIDIWGVEDTRGIETYSRVGLITKRIPHLGNLLDKSMGLFGLTFYITIPFFILLLLCERIYKIKRSKKKKGIDNIENEAEDNANEQAQPTAEDNAFGGDADEFRAETVTSDFVSVIKEKEISISNTAEIEIEAEAKVKLSVPEENIEKLIISEPHEIIVESGVPENREGISFGEVYEALDRAGAGVTFVEADGIEHLSHEDRRRLELLDNIDPRAEIEKIIDADNKLSIHNIDNADKNQMEEITKTIIQNKNDITNQNIGLADKRVTNESQSIEPPKPYLTADEILAIRREQALRKEQMHVKKNKNSYVRVEGDSQSDEHSEMAKLYYQSEISDYKE